MKEHRESPNDTSPASADHIGRLLRLAGPRPAAPRECESRVREAVRERWRTTVRARRRRRWLVRGGLGLAAAAALAAAIGRMLVPAPPPEPVFEGTVARVESVAGSVRLTGDGFAGEELAVGDRVPADAVIDTGELGRVAVRLASGASLRLDRETRLRGVSDRIVALESGALYFDSGAAGARDPGAVPVEIRTTHGVVHDVGTQFEVRLEDRGLRVRVREGAVNLAREGRRYDAGAGVELTVDAGGSLSRRSIPIFGPEWEWILAVAPPFDIEGRTLAAFLDWVVRETGWQPRFVDPEAGAGADGVVLHGSIADMPPDQALEAVLPTCGLVHRLDSGILTIQAEGP